MKQITVDIYEPQEKMPEIEQVVLFEAMGDEEPDEEGLNMFFGFWDGVDWIDISTSYRIPDNYIVMYWHDIRGSLAVEHDELAD